MNATRLGLLAGLLAIACSGGVGATESLPLIVLDSGQAIEGTGGFAIMSFRVLTTAPSAVPVSFHYRSEDFTAQAPADYLPADDTFTIPPGATVVQLPMFIVSDYVAEPLEVFELVLSDAVNGRLVQSRVVGSIIDDDTPLPAEIAGPDVEVRRGLSGSRVIQFPLQLNQPLDHPVSVRATTMDLTAIAGRDYLANSQVLTFQPGQTQQQFLVTIFGVLPLTPTKIFFVQLDQSSVTLARPALGGTLDWGRMPLVSLTSPAAGTRLVAPATIVFTATASDPDSSIASVAFYSDGVELALDDAPPYSYIMKNAPAGLYQLFARATNTHGDKADTAQISVYVFPPSLDTIFASGFETQTP